MNQWTKDQCKPKGVSKNLIAFKEQGRLHSHWCKRTLTDSSSTQHVTEEKTRFIFVSKHVKCYTRAAGWSCRKQLSDSSEYKSRRGFVETFLTQIFSLFDRIPFTFTQTHTHTECSLRIPATYQIQSLHGLQKTIKYHLSKHFTR